MAAPSRAEEEFARIRCGLLSSSQDPQYVDLGCDVCGNPDAFPDAEGFKLCIQHHRMLDDGR